MKGQLTVAIAMLTAINEGKEIQWRAPGKGTTEWTDYGTPNVKYTLGALLLPGYEYRVKPKPRKVWITCYPTRTQLPPLGCPVGAGYNSREEAEKHVQKEEGAYVKEIEI